MGFLHYDPRPMTLEHAREILRVTNEFDYLKGRVMKINLSSDELNPSGYDLDNGQGAAALAIDSLAITGDANSLHHQVTHQTGRSEAAGRLLEHLPGESSVATEGEATVVSLGMSDVADVLLPVVKAKMGDDEEPDFAQLAKEGERVNAFDDIQRAIYKVAEADPEAMKLVMRILEHDLLLFLLLDSRHLYGRRITQLHSDICGGDWERFLYHLQMELPNQGTGVLSITGPYCSMSEEETQAFFAARKSGKPGSFWALANPPTDPHYEYPIKLTA